MALQPKVGINQINGNKIVVHLFTQLTSMQNIQLILQKINKLYIVIHLLDQYLEMENFSESLTTQIATFRVIVPVIIAQRTQTVQRVQVVRVHS